MTLRNRLQGVGTPLFVAVVVVILGVMGLLLRGLFLRQGAADARLAKAEQQLVKVIENQAQVIETQASIEQIAIDLAAQQTRDAAAAQERAESLEHLTKLSEDANAVLKEVRGITERFDRLSGERAGVIRNALQQIEESQRRVFEGRQFTVVDPRFPDRPPLVVTPVPRPDVPPEQLQELCRALAGVGNVDLLRGIACVKPAP